MNPNPAGYPTSMQQHVNPMLAATAGYPVQAGNPNSQQFSYYAANPMAAYPPQMQQQQPSQPRPGQMSQHAFNPMQMQTSAPNGAPMMPAHMLAPHANMAYSSPSSYHPNSIPATSASPSHSQSPAPTAAVSMSGPPQSMPAGANPAMLLAQQQQQQHQQQLQLHLKQQQQQQQQAQPQLQQQSMQQQRSTPTNQSLGQQPQQNQQAQAQQVAPPSPAAAARERARVTALLEVNSALLQELLSLQASGKAGGAPQATATTTPEQQSALPNSATEPAGAPSDTPRKPSPEYLECLKRLQSNLVYLASVTDRNKKPVSPAPAILSPPPHMGSLNEKYSQLKELFAGVPRPAVVPQQKPGQPGIAAEHAV